MALLFDIPPEPPPMGGGIGAMELLILGALCCVALAGSLAAVGVGVYLMRKRKADAEVPPPAP